MNSVVRLSVARNMIVTASFASWILELSWHWGLLNIIVWDWHMKEAGEGERCSARACAAPCTSEPTWPYMWPRLNITATSEFFVRHNISRSKVCRSMNSCNNNFFFALYYCQYVRTECLFRVCRGSRNMENRWVRTSQTRTGTDAGRGSITARRRCGGWSNSGPVYNLSGVEAMHKNVGLWVRCVILHLWLRVVSEQRQCSRYGT